jgi:hypothetical protein
LNAPRDESTAGLAGRAKKDSSPRHLVFSCWLG